MAPRRERKFERKDESQEKEVDRLSWPIGKEGEERYIILYKWLLRFLALENDWTLTEEVMEAYCREYDSEGAGWSRSWIYEVLNNLKEENLLERGRHENERRGPNPHVLRITEDGKEKAVYFWGDLELVKGKVKKVRRLRI